MQTPQYTDVRSIPLGDLIPQRAPFLMIDCLTSFDPVVSSTELSVRADNVFVENGCLTAPGMLENIAQTCAARIGYINLTSGEPVKIGFIGAIRNLTIHRTPRVGETLHTTIVVKSTIFQMTLVDAYIKCGEEVLAEGEMKIALSDIEPTDRQA